jgi:hypothetical protein
MKVVNEKINLAASPAGHSQSEIGFKIKIDFLLKNRLFFDLFDIHLNLSIFKPKKKCELEVRTNELISLI